MIVTRAPARISFGGGGTDLPGYYEQYGGFVVSATIDCHCYVTVREPGDGMVHLHARDYQRSIVTAPEDLPLDDRLFRFPAAVLDVFFGDVPGRRGIELVIESEIPVSAGLGSSSALTVALAQAVAGYTGRNLTADEIADLACEIEIDRLERCIGKQDQYASARGGLNAITFSHDGVDVRPIEMPPERLDAYFDRLLLFGTGHTRDAAEVLQQQSQATTTRQSSVVDGLHKLKALAREMVDALESGDLDGFGALLDAGWNVKRGLSSRVSSPEIDGWYRAARSAGALGGKLCGAGGGGHLLFLCAEGRQGDVRAMMTGTYGLRELDLQLDRAGVCLLPSADELTGASHERIASD